MPALTQRDQRTIRMAVVAIACYLALFYGGRVWRHFEGGRAEYFKLLKEAARLKGDIQPYENKVLLVEKLKDAFHIDPSKWSKATLVAEASAAIQKAAMSGGVQLGPIHESASRATGRELASMQLEGFGPVPAVMAFLHSVETCGYPLTLTSIQLGSDPTKPGMIKVSFTILIWDFDQWKSEEARHA
jgi:hypothetical protein